MGEMSLPSRDSIRSASSQETAGEDSVRQRSIDGSMAVESASQTKSQVEMNQNINSHSTSTKSTSSLSVAATIDQTKSLHRGKLSESSLDSSSINQADQGFHGMPPRHEQYAPTVVVDMPPEKQSASQVPSEQRSVTPSDLSNGGSAAVTNSASPDPKKLVQQQQRHREKPPPAPIIQQQTALSTESTTQQQQGRRPSLTTTATMPPPYPGKPATQQPQERPPAITKPAVPKQFDTPQSTQRVGSRFTITPVTSVPPIPVQPAVQQPQDRRPSLATSTATASTQQSMQSGSQHVDSTLSYGSQTQVNQEHQPQHVQTDTITPLPPTPNSVPSKMPQPQALKHRSVSVPCAPQPYPPEYQEKNRSHSERQTGSQPTLFYQIPGVIPVQTMPPTDGSGRQTQDQIIGMVGAIPIMKIQEEGGIRYKQKGRFKLLQETVPATVPTPAAVPEVVPTPAETVTSTPMVVQSEESQSPQLAYAAPATGASQAAPTTMEPKAVGEPRTVVAAAPSPATNGNVTTQQFPETFDDSVPTIKKKGRFLVSNVKDLRNMIPAQKAMDAQQSLQLPIMTQPATEQPLTQPVIAPVTQQPVTQQVTVPVIQQPVVQQVTVPVTQQPVVQQVTAPVTQQQVTQPVVPATIAVQHTNVEAVPTSHPMGAVPVAQLNTTSSPFFSLQGAAVITQPYPVNPPAHQQPDAQQQAQQIHSQRMTPVPLHTQSNTPPQTPAVAGTFLTNESPRKTKSQLEIPKATEKARITPTIAKKKVPLSARTAPHAMDRGGKLSLGKLSYYLDQMKSEVTDADILIRTLQTDLKLMRDKNKELEAKNKTLEKSLKEEKILRETAEARNIELRKQMRESKTLPGSNGQKQPDQAADGTATNTAANAKKNGSVGATSKPPEAAPPSKPQRDPSPAPVASNLEKQSQLHPCNAGNKVNRPATNGVSLTPSKGLASGSNSLGREQSKRAVGHGWHARSNSLGDASAFFLQRDSNDSMNASPSKASGGVLLKPRQEPMNTANTNGPTPVQSQPAAQGVQRVLCVSDFDPLHQNQAAAGIANDVVPIMIPVPPQYDHNQFMAENNIVVPITLGMAPAVDQANVENGMQQQGINHNIRSLQQPSFMVFPQQQQFMVQQVPGGIQRVPNFIAGQLPQGMPNNQNALPSYVPQMMQQPPQQAPSQFYYSTDSFDPLK